MKVDPSADIQVPRQERRLPRGVFTIEELKNIMAQPDLDTIVGYRDRTMMEVLYSTGVRARELANLTLDDVDLEKKVARVRQGKGAKERFVLISTPCARFLAKYIADVRPKLVPGIRFSGNSWHSKFRTGGDLLFLSVYGGPIGTTWLAQVMRGYILRAGITRPFSPVHSFRHTVATHLMENGMDVRFVQVFLGHNSIDSTQIYTHVERATLKKHFKECHPLEIDAGDVKPFVAAPR